MKHAAISFLVGAVCFFVLRAILGAWGFHTIFISMLAVLAAHIVLGGDRQ